MFLKYRTAFIRQFYNSAALSFVERKRKIEAREHPFEPSYSEDDYPPFLSEWTEADQSLEVLGQMCVSLLAAALQLYLKEWQMNFFRYYGAKGTAGIKNISVYQSDFKKHGWFNGYKAYSSKELGIVWDESPANLTLLEEIVLTRNRVQHPEHIALLHVQHSENDVKKLPQVFFMNERELELLGKVGSEPASWIIPPTISISKDRVHHAIDQVEMFCCWLEEQHMSWGTRPTKENRGRNPI